MDMLMRMRLLVLLRVVAHAGHGKALPAIPEQDEGPLALPAKQRGALAAAESARPRSRLPPAGPRGRAAVTPSAGASVTPAGADAAGEGEEGGEDTGRFLEEEEEEDGEGEGEGEGDDMASYMGTVRE